MGETLYSPEPQAIFYEARLASYEMIFDVRASAIAEKKGKSERERRPHCDCLLPLRFEGKKCITVVK